MILTSNRVVLPDGEHAAALHINHGRIVAIDLTTTEAPADIDVGDLVISPGIVDSHVHVNEPGRTEWEGFDTATRAAAAGGVTTIVDMPLNSIPATTTSEALEAKREAARGRVHVDVAFWGGVVPGNAHEIDGLVDAGVRGFKCFLVPSGVDEFPAVSERDLREAMPILARREVPLLVHAEDPRIIAECGMTNGDRRAHRYVTYLATRPAAAEVAAIELMVRLAREFGTRVHIVHVACAEAIPVIAEAKADGVPITAETCPHYLSFAAEDVPDGATEFKCAPPIREAHHRDALWQGLRDGVLDLVATDHSPAPPAMKCTGDFMGAWGGIASLELSLSAVWTRAGASGAELANWLSAAPARLARLDHRKGRIAVGYDADLVVWDPDVEFAVDAAGLQQRHKLTPYAGARLRGRVRQTFLRGEPVWSDQTLRTPPRGELL